MANYSNITLTKDGQAVLTQAIVSGTAQFTKVKTGSGVYAAGEVLSDKTDLKSIRQIIPITGVIKKDRTTVLIRCVITNDGITEEYPINELGLYAMNTETNKEVLFALVVASNPDYIIPFEQTPMSITLELYISITDADNVTFSFELVEGIYATAEDLVAHEADTIKHVTSAERTAWNAKLGATATAANSDKVDGYHASDFVFLTNFWAGNLGAKVKYYSSSMGKDCNDIDELVVLAIGAEGLHFPTANAFYYIFTMKYTDTEKKQVAFEYVGNKIYVRHSKGGVWNEWGAVALVSDILASISTKVVVSETAPTDTTALWVW